MQLRLCSRRSAAVGLECLNQAHHLATLGTAMGLVWRVRTGLWLGRWSGFSLAWGLNGDLTFKEQPDPMKQVAITMAEEAVIAHLDEAFGQHVLQEATDELLGGDSTVSSFPCVGVLVAKGDLVICQFHDAIVADAYSKDVRGQIFQGCHPIADRLTMNHPRLPCLPPLCGSPP